MGHEGNNGVFCHFNKQGPQKCSRKKQMKIPQQLKKTEKRKSRKMSPAGVGSKAIKQKQLLKIENVEKFKFKNMT